MKNFYDKLPKKVAEEIEILRSQCMDASFRRDATLRALIMSEFKAYLRALEHMGLITKEERQGLIKSAK